jgi:hypothetical protein
VKSRKDVAVGRVRRLSKQLFAAVVVVVVATSTEEVHADDPDPAAEGKAPDFVHRPAAEQQVRTPIPIYLEYVGSTPIVRVIARYKGLGMADWQPVGLRRMGDRGWGGLVPCADVQPGTILYFVQAFDANNDPVATLGDRNHPFSVPVRPTKVASPPHLPATDPPVQCGDAGDCPPSFPGCTSPRSPLRPEEGDPIGREDGDFCEEDGECASGLCGRNRCVDPEAKPAVLRKIWVGVAITGEYSFAPSTDDACKLDPNLAPVNGHNYYCVRSDGSDYPARNIATGRPENEALLPTGPRGGDQAKGGGALGNVRLLLSLDVALSPNLLLGGRLGLVLNTYPGDAAGADDRRFAIPLHLEARGTWVFGKDALLRTALLPYAFGALGVGRFETRIPVQVVEARAGVPAVSRDVDAWHIAGPAFVSVGGGGRLALSERAALLFGLRANLAFLDAFAASIGPELAGQIGF